MKKKEETNHGQAEPDDSIIEKPFEIEKFELAKNFNVKAFSCGVPELDKYATQLLKQDVKRGLTSCYCIEDSGNLIGFYTLSSASVDASQYLSVRDGVGKYLPVPVTLIGRLAVDVSHQGAGIGPVMLLDAISRAIDASDVIASKALIVDAINQKAISFYESFGFSLIPDSNRLLLTIEEAKRLMVV